MLRQAEHHFNLTKELCELEKQDSEFAGMDLGKTFDDCKKVAKRISESYDDTV